LVSRFNFHYGAGVSIRLMHFDNCPFHLTVVVVNASMLERIPYAFLKVVPVATAAIRRIEIELNLEWTRKRLADPPREESADAFAIQSPLTAQERAIANMPVIPVNARRERQHKSKHGYRLCRTVR